MELKEVEKQLLLSRQKYFKNMGRLCFKNKERGSSVGAVIQIIASESPQDWGNQFFKIDALLAQGIMSIPAVKGVETVLRAQH